MPIRILIADDHQLFRLGMVAILERNGNFKIIGEASSGLQLLEKLKVPSNRPDIILLDLNMPELSGMDALIQITKLYKDIKVIVVSMYDGDNYIANSIENGACGFLNKNAKPEEVERAIESVHESSFYFNDKTSKAMLKTMVSRKRLKPIFDNSNISLSDSELNVIKYICEELTSDEIAKRMYLSTRTIEGIRSDLIKKIGVKNSVGLVMFAAKNQLIGL